jgi:hypothetical protein
VPQQSSKTTIRTFRIEKTALETIERDAKQKKVSVNTLVNQLLLAYANYDRYLEQFPMMKIVSPLFGFLLDGVSDDYAKGVARRLAQNLVQGAIVSRRGGLNLSTLVDHMKLVSEYSNIYTFKEAEPYGRRTITLYHRFGRKGSVYFREYLETLFEMLEMRPKLTTTENSVTASL